MARFFSTVHLLVSASLFAPSLGQEALAPTYLPTSGERQQLAPVIVADRTERTYSAHRTATATRTDRALVDIPQSLSVVTRELIDDQAMQGMADVTRQVPGAGIAQGEGNRDAPVLRGNSTTADFLVDGLRDDVQYFRDLYAVDRVEVLKGPNAMIFGRGGAGGIINRVMKQPTGETRREVALSAGSWGQVRSTVDFGGSASPALAYRLAALFEESGSYRDGVTLRRQGIQPMLGGKVGARTAVRASWEHFRDERTADRGVPSLRGRPLATDASTFFGDSDQSTSVVTADALQSLLDHSFGSAARLRASVRLSRHDKAYQNVFPGALDATATAVSLSAYRNATQRESLLHQTDLVVPATTGPVVHQILTGFDFARQDTSNVRLTGHFTTVGPAVTSITVPLATPRIHPLITFRPGATDADNQGVAESVALHVQDQLTIRPWLQGIVGVRREDFSVDFLDRRTGGRIRTHDRFLSPRLALIIKPAGNLSAYISRSVAHLPRAGEQLSSLTPTNRVFAPERFTSHEAGVKWDARPDLAFTASAYRLDRSNVVIPDPADVSRSLLARGQRTEGVELGLTGRFSNRWTVVGGYAYQEGRLTASQATTALAGARLAQLPRHSLSLWNRCDVSGRWGFGIGLIHRGEIFAATDNAVVLPGFVRLDGALFTRLSPRLRLQLNVENLLDRAYHASAHSNNNLTPGSPRAVRLGLAARL